MKKRATNYLKADMSVYDLKFLTSFISRRASTERELCPFEKEEQQIILFVLHLLEFAFSVLLESWPDYFSLQVAILFKLLFGRNSVVYGFCILLNFNFKNTAWNFLLFPFFVCLEVIKFMSFLLF